MFQTKVVEKLKIHILCSVPFSEYNAVYQITSKKVVEPERSQMTTWRLRVACAISKATRAQEHCRAPHPNVRTHSPKRAPTHTEIRNTYCFSTATMVSRTRLNVT